MSVLNEYIRIQPGFISSTDPVLLMIAVAKDMYAFLLGFMQSFMLLEHLSNKTVALFTVDTLSKKVFPKDGNSYPLIGDAAGISIIENDSKMKDIHFNFYNYKVLCKGWD